MPAPPPTGEKPPSTLECEGAKEVAVGLGPQGDDYVRFVMIDNEQRIAQASRQLKRGLPKLG